MKFIVLITLLILQSCNGFETPMASPRFQPNPETPTHFEPEIPHNRTPAYEEVPAPVEVPELNQEVSSIPEEELETQISSESASTPIVTTTEPTIVSEIVPEPIVSVPNPSPVVPEVVQEEILLVPNPSPVVVIPASPVEDVDVSEEKEPAQEIIPVVADTPVIEDEQIEHEVVKEEITPESVVETVEPVQLFPSIPLVSSNTIPEGTREIVSMFVFYASLFNKKVSWEKLIIKMEPAPKEFFIGYCSMVNNNKNPQITLNGSFWNQLSFTYKEQLLFHELGHCLLNRSHEGNDFYNPTSIMNKSFFSESTYKNQYDFFIKELFGNENHQDHFEYGTLYPHVH